MFQFTHSLSRDYDATFTVEDFTPGEAPTRDNPGEGPIASLGATVTLTDGDTVDTEVPLDQAVRIYQGANRLASYEDAERELIDVAIEAYADHLEARYEDAMEARSDALRDDG